jgi:hypothetical protein
MCDVICRIRAKKHTVCQRSGWTQRKCLYFETMCGNIAHGFPLLIVTKFTHGFILVAMCFNFTMLRLCQSFSFFWSIADVEATLIVCVFPRFPHRIPIIVCALAFISKIQRHHAHIDHQINVMVL